VEQTPAEHRNVFLVFATVFANIFLVSFAADAGLSLADEVMNLGSAGSPIHDIRVLLGDLVVLGALAMLVVIIFAPQLPKVVFLPLIFFALWAAFEAPPFDMSQPSTAVSLAIVQVALIAGMLLINKLRSGNWLLSARLLPCKTHLVMRMIGSFVVLGLVLPIFALTLLLAAMGSMIEKQTGGYLQFTSSGIDVRETIMRRDTKTVRLVGMVHVGETKFYEQLYASFPPSALVLAEGVTDRNGKLAEGLSYKGFAEMLGLKVQPQLFEPAQHSGRKPGAAKVTPRPASAVTSPLSIPATATRPRIIYADADVSDFSPTTLRFLSKVGELYASGSFNELLTRLTAISEQFSENDLAGVFDDILNKRNARLLVEFDKRVGDYDMIILPWGAQHMPGLQAALVQRGFRIESERMLDVARYQTIIDRVWAVIHPPPPQSKTSFSYRQKKWIG
jgi:hypothetical protein